MLTNKQELSIQRAKSADATTRYIAFIELVAETETLWILESQDYVLTLDSEDGEELLPVWPSESLAHDAIESDEAEGGFQAVSRTLQQWLEKSVPNLVSENVLVGVFPDKRRKCPVIAADKLASDLEKAMSRLRLMPSALVELTRRV
jgi:hypothetical protein